MASGIYNVEIIIVSFIKRQCVKGLQWHWQTVAVVCVNSEQMEHFTTYAYNPFAYSHWYASCTVCRYYWNAGSDHMLLLSTAAVMSTDLHLQSFTCIWWIYTALLADYCRQCGIRTWAMSWYYPAAIRWHVVGWEEPEEVWQGSDEWSAGWDNRAAEALVYGLPPQWQYVALSLCYRLDSLSQRCRNSLSCHCF